jgi:NitT/TauT family transport system permease protein
VALFLSAWTLTARAYPAFILPSPARVYARFVVVALDGTLWRHALATLTEATLGFAIGFAVAVVVGYAIAKSPTVEKAVSPFIVASQSFPIVAVAPLLVLWFGTGLLSKILVCALIVFFPIVVNAVVGLRSVDPRAVELMRSFSASRLDIFTRLEVPAALPVLFGGLRIGITLSVIGAVVGEFVGATRGLGFLVTVARGLYDTPLMFVGIFSLVAIALTLYIAVAWLEKRFVRRPGTGE